VRGPGRSASARVGGALGRGRRGAAREGLAGSVCTDMTDPEPTEPLPDDAPATEEIVALRGLGQTPDERWVAWAVRMLEEGRDSRSLRILAGETGPFSSFELLPLVDRAFDELGIAQHPDATAAGIALARVRARQMLDRRLSQEDGLAELARLHEELDARCPLDDFYLLYHALDDLRYGESQCYWPEGDHGTMAEVIDSECRRWLEEHGETGAE
jgi:hypothetical protein